MKAGRKIMVLFMSVMLTFMPLAEPLE